MSTQIDHAIAAYRSELEAEAELARGDLAELEDHMRLLIDELRATGASSEQAIASARMRLGDPKQLAREHARVRSPFGAKLSRARAWSAGGLFLAMVVLAGVAFAGQALQVGWFAIELVIGVILGCALIARLAWARAAVLGFLAYTLVHIVVTWIAYDLTFGPLSWVFFGMRVGVLAFVLPWRRGEVGPAGYALALVSVMYVGAAWVIAFEYPLAEITPELIAAHIAHAVTIVAGIGIVMRARFAAPAAAIAAIALSIAASQVLDVTFDFAISGVERVMVVGTVLAGVAAAFACTTISWRTARSTFGSLRGFAS